jgi:hypothetical protein
MFATSAVVRNRFDRAVAGVYARSWHGRALAVICGSRSLHGTATTCRAVQGSSTTSTSLARKPFEGAAGAFHSHRSAVVGQLQRLVDHVGFGSRTQRGLVGPLRYPMVGAHRHIADHLAVNEPRLFGWLRGMIVFFTR